ncbi:MAG: hypothetical protein ABW000_03860 [Actinoplanes sp.]
MRDVAVPDLTGKLAVITGGSDGLGPGPAARFARAGLARVEFPARPGHAGLSARGH